MRSRDRWATWNALVFFALTGVAHGQVLTPVTQSRSVEATIDDFGGFPLVETDAAVDFSAFSESVVADDMGIPSSRAEAEQSSAVNTAPDALTASGAVSGFPAWSGGDTQAIAESRYRVEFDLSSPVSYSATGDAFTERGVSNALEAFVFANVSVNLRDVTGGGTIVDSFFTADDGGAATINLSGTLPAGRYELSIFGGVDVLADFSEQFASASATYDVTFSVTAIPEPGALTLIAAAGPLLAAGARRRGRRERRIAAGR